MINRWRKYKWVNVVYVGLLMHLTLPLLLRVHLKKSLENDQPVLRAGPPAEGLLGADGSQSVGAKFRS